MMGTFFERHLVLLQHVLNRNPLAGNYLSRMSTADRAEPGAKQLPSRNTGKVDRGIAEPTKMTSLHSLPYLTLLSISK